MRTVLPALVVICVCAGCQQRSDMSAMPDRQGHAYQPARTSVSPAPSARPSVAVASGRSVVVRDGERLYEIAEREGVGLWRLIVVNDLVARPTAGDVLSLPR